MPVLNYDTSQTILPCLAYCDDVLQLWLYLKLLPYLRLHMRTKPTEAGLEGACRVTRRRVLFGLGRDVVQLCGPAQDQK